MPDNLVPMVVTSGLGFGVIAGVVSGICYVFIQGFRSTGTRRGKYGVNNPWQCCICGAHFNNPDSSNSIPTEEFDSITGITITKPSLSSTSSSATRRKYSVCEGCNGHACRTTCGQWINERGEWLCKQCVLYELQNKTRDAVLNGKENRSWFKSILTALQPNTVTVRMSKPRIRDSLEGVSSKDEAKSERANEGQASDNGGDEKEIVRDFIERLVGAMLGADLDDTSVGRLYADAEYDAMFDRYHGDISTALTELGSALHISIANLPVSGQTPCTAHASLKNIIRHVLRDASNMAILKEPQNEPETPEATTSRTYEDLLATAILNKVIDNYQTDLRRSSSGSTSSKRSDSSKRHKSRKYDDERWRTSIDNPDLDTTSMSSVEEWCRSESSCGSKYVDHTSFTIHQSIEEITTSDDEQSNNQYLHAHNLSQNSFRNNDKETKLYEENWQDNWLFSRKAKGSPKPVPVPMLVPNPSTDFRALIGDRDAEDTTDLSETGSDLDEADSVQDIKSILIDSRTIIGGKNLLENITIDYEEPQNTNDEKCINIKMTTAEIVNEEANKDSGVDEDLVSEAKNNTLIHEVPYVESDSLSSNTEKDMEYTERYASIPRQISKDKKTPIPVPRTKESINEQQKPEKIQQNEVQEVTMDIHENNPTEEEDDEDIEEEAPIIIKGSYSTKEKEKWRNPVALSNNPYSKENLDKRLNSKSNNLNSLFGRDYYVREAKKAAGGRKKFLDESDSTTESSRHDSDQESVPVSKEIIINEEQTVFTAVPAIIQEEEIREQSDTVPDLESIPSSRPISLALSTDSEDIKVYNLETGKVTTYKNKDFTKEIIENSKSPEGMKNLVEPNELISSNLPDEVDSKFDENQNISKEANREPVMNISKLNHVLRSTSEPAAPITKREFLLQQISVQEPDIEIFEKDMKPVTPELRDVSKKYLQSLIKNKSNTEVVTKPPPATLQEINGLTPVQTAFEVTTPPISLQENSDENHEDVDEIDNRYYLQNPPKSCIDLRLVPNYKPTKSESSMDDSESTPPYTNGYSNSTSNLNDENLYLTDQDDDISGHKKTSDLEELEALPKPSVRDLKKIFDQDKPAKVNVTRSKSALTTKPEFHAHQIHSLTARSLPKKYGQDSFTVLQKSKDEKDAIIENNGSAGETKLETTEEIKEPETIPPCKSKIEFFEMLKQK